MVETAQIISLEDYRSTHLLPQEVVTVDLVEKGDSSSSKKRETDVGELYSADTPSGNLVVHARRLLSEVARRAQNAQSYLASDDVVGSDNELAHLQASLPELFCCRDLSEGLGAFTVALFHALQNRRSAALNEDQIFSIRTCVTVVHDTPFITFEQSLDLVERLITSGLVTDPPEAEILSDAFIKEGLG